MPMLKLTGKKKKKTNVYPTIPLLGIYKTCEHGKTYIKISIAV